MTYHDGEHELTVDINGDEGRVKKPELFIPAVYPGSEPVPKHYTCPVSGCGGATKGVYFCSLTIAETVMEGIVTAEDEKTVITITTRFPVDRVSYGGVP